jgi:hypothetical protein
MMGWKGRTTGQGTRASTILQSLAVDWAQSMGIIFLLNLRWPPDAAAVLSATRLGSSLGIRGMSCLTSFNYDEGLLFSALSFVSLASGYSLFVFANYLALRSKGQSLKHWMKETDNIRSWARGIKFLYTLSFPGLATAGFSHFQCISMAEDRRWLRTSLSQECSGPEYESLSWVAGLALVQVFVPPLVILVALWRSKFKHMKYFIANYTPEAWFFEIYRLEMQDVGIGSRPVFARSKTIIDL